jgi:hypothetical protein
MAARPLSRVIGPHLGPHPSRWKDSQHLHWLVLCLCHLTYPWGHLQRERPSDIRGKEIKNSQQILQLLEAVWKPRAIAVIHSPAQTNWPDKISQGNGLLDRIAKEAALSEEVQKEDATLAEYASPSLPPGRTRVQPTREWTGPWNRS